MPDYQKGKIYKIIDNTNGKVYIGSTAQPTLSRRLSGHKGHYKHYLAGKGRYCKSFSILENKDFRIILICNYPCDNIDELHKKEQYYIDSYECINTHKAFQSSENRKDYLKQLRLNNYEYRRQQDKERYAALILWGDSYNNLCYIDTNLFL
tara:strand:- start:4539 stop:4991 length:453 start_codon:yes stop_codon:yes gene_type:complete